MRRFLLLAGVVVASSAMSMSAEAVCNIKGQYCDYPAWAANAFTSPMDRVPDAWLEDRARWTSQNGRAASATKAYRRPRHR
jgi:hypothetical protein